MNKLYSYIIVLLVFLLSSCNRDNSNSSDEELLFLNEPDIGLFSAKKYLVRYNVMDFQIAVNRGRKAIRIQNDIQNEYFNVDFKYIPNRGSNSSAYVYCHSTSFQGSLQLSLEVIRRTSDRVWLWDSDKNTGIILYSKDLEAVLNF